MTQWNIQWHKASRGLCDSWASCVHYLCMEVTIYDFCHSREHRCSRL